MTKYNYKNACSNINPVLLNKYIADPDSETGYQSWIVGRVYNALRRCASQHNEYPTVDQLLYMVVDVVGRFSSMRWEETRAGRTRKGSEHKTPCLHCEQCTERANNIDRTIRPEAKHCNHARTVQIKPKQGKKLPHGIKSWLEALIDQCYNSNYIKRRGWLASDERPAAVEYMKDYRPVTKVQSLRPLDIVAAIHTQHDSHPEMVRYAEAQLSGLITQQDLDVAEMLYAAKASVYRDGTKHRNCGEPKKVGDETIAAKLGIGRRAAASSREQLAAILAGRPTTRPRSEPAPAPAPPEPLPALPRSKPDPEPAPLTMADLFEHEWDEMVWNQAVCRWEKEQDERRRSERSAEPKPLWQQLGMVDPELLAQQMEQKRRQLDSWMKQLQDV